MRKLIESTLVSLDGVTEAPEQWANWDAEDTALDLNELVNYDAFVKLKMRLLGDRVSRRTAWKGVVPVAHLEALTGDRDV